MLNKRYIYWFVLLISFSFSAIDSVTQSTTDYIRRSVLDVSNDGSIISITGRIIQDTESRTGVRYPIDFYNSVTGQLLGTFQGSEDDILDIEINPSSTLLAYNNSNGRLAIVDLQTFEEDTILDEGGFIDIGVPIWSHDGAYLMSSIGNNILIYETTNWLQIGSIVEELSYGSFGGLDWGLDNYIAISTRNINTQQGMLAVWDATNPQEPILLNRTSLPLGLTLSWSPSGNSLALVTPGGVLNVIPFENNQNPILLASQDQEQAILALSWRFDEIRLAGGGTNGIHIWNVETGEVIETYSTDTTVYGVEWSPDGQYLYHTGGTFGIYRNGIPLQEAITQEANAITQYTLVQ